MSEFLQQSSLILASGSKARARLLENLGLRFHIALSEVDEDSIKKAQTSAKPENLGLALARAKGIAVSALFPDNWVIAADQLCVMDGRLFSKPKHHEQAVKQLLELAGRDHWQYSAACLVLKGKVVWQGVERARLRLRPLSDASIERYLKQETPYQSCGSYHYENAGRWLFERIEGSDACIQGLPLQSLCNALIDHKVVWF